MPADVFDDEEAYFLLRFEKQERFENEKKEMLSESQYQQCPLKMS